MLKQFTATACLLLSTTTFASDCDSSKITIRNDSDQAYTIVGVGPSAVTRTIMFGAAITGLGYTHMSTGTVINPHSSLTRTADSSFMSVGHILWNSVTLEDSDHHQVVLSVDFTANLFSNGCTAYGSATSTFHDVTWTNASGTPPSFEVVIAPSA